MFRSEDVLPDALMARVTEMRVHDPEFAVRAAAGRMRRAELAPAGRLNILAADINDETGRLQELVEALSDRWDLLLEEDPDADELPPV